MLGALFRRDCTKRRSTDTGPTRRGKNRSEWRRSTYR